MVNFLKLYPKTYFKTCIWTEKRSLKDFIYDILQVQKRCVLLEQAHRLADLNTITENLNIAEVAKRNLFGF